MNGEMISEPMTSALLTTPVRIMAVAVDSEYRKLVQAVFTSMAAQPSAPMRRWMPGGDVGHLVVVAGGADDDQLDLAAVDAGAGQRARRGHVTDLAQRHVRDAPLANAGARQDPLVGGVEESREVRVAEHRGRQAFAPSDDGRVSETGCWHGLGG